jgi:alkaline phosphatase D
MHTQTSTFLTRSMQVATLSLAMAVATITTDVYASEAPRMDQGIQIGDVTEGRAIIWSRTDRPARMWVQYAFNKYFTDAITVRGPYATPESDFTARQDLTQLPEGKNVFVKVWFEDLTNEHTISEAVNGSFRTLSKRDNIHFVWGGDTNGQGWGINESFGGMKIYEAMESVNQIV